MLQRPVLLVWTKCARVLASGSICAGLPSMTSASRILSKLQTGVRPNILDEETDDVEVSSERRAGDVLGDVCLTKPPAGNAFLAETVRHLLSDIPAPPG